MTTTPKIAGERLRKILTLSYIAVAESWFPNLVFEPSGLTRLAHIFGWITGLAQSGDEKLREFAAQAADDIFDNLERLNRYGSEVVPEGFPDDILPVSSYRVALTDDGTFNGFSLLWLAVAPRDTKEGDCYGAAERWAWSKREGYSIPVRYRFSFNGGLLYHGPGGGETFAVTLTPCLWSVHT